MDVLLLFLLLLVYHFLIILILGSHVGREKKIMDDLSKIKDRGFSVFCDLKPN